MLFKNKSTFLISLIFSTFIVLFTFSNFALAEEEDEQEKSRDRLQIHNVEMINKCKEEGLENEECSRIINFAFTSMKTDLQDILDHLETRLEEMLDKAVQTGDLTQEEANSIMEEYQDLIDEIKVEVENAESVEDLQGFATRAKTQDKYKELLQRVSSLQMNNRYNALENTVARLSKFTDRLQAHIDAAEAAGADEEKIAELNDALFSVNADITGMQAVVNSRDITNLQTSKELFKTTRGDMRDIHSELKDIVESLKELYKETPWKVPAQDE